MRENRDVNLRRPKNQNRCCHRIGDHRCAAESLDSCRKASADIQTTGKRNWYGNTIEQQQDAPPRSTGTTTTQHRSGEHAQQVTACASATSFSAHVEQRSDEISAPNNDQRRRSRCLLPRGSCRRPGLDPRSCRLHSTERNRSNRQSDQQSRYRLQTTARAWKTTHQLIDCLPRQLRAGSR